MSAEFVACEGAGLYYEQSACALLLIMSPRRNALQATTAAAPTPRSASRTTRSSSSWSRCGTLRRARFSCGRSRRGHPQQEITISYIEECMLHRCKRGRAEYLRDNYLFTCTCDKCAEQTGRSDESDAEDGSHDGKDHIHDDWEDDNA